MNSLRWVLWSGLIAVLPLRAVEQVEVAVKPPGPWKKYPTRTLEDLPAVLARAEAAGVGQMVTIGTHLSRAAQSLSR